MGEKMTGDPMRHGAFGWVDLITTDVGSAKDFYGKLFGWKYENHAMGTDYVMIEAGGAQSGGMMAINGPEKPQWNVYVTVRDIEETVRLVKELGGKVTMPPEDVEKVGRFAMIEDPQGARIALAQYLSM